MRVAAALASAIWLLVVLAAPQVERAKPRWTGNEGARYLEVARAARPALLGYEAFAADVVWMQGIQYIADRLGSRKDLSGLYPFLDAATEFDPRYQQVYWLGGTALVALDRRPDDAVRLLEKGRRALPDDWRVPYLLGYTHLFYYQDYGTAARYIEEAARKVGRPTYMTALAVRLHAQSGSPEAALEFLVGMYRSATDPAVRAGLETRIKEVVVDRDLRAIDAAVGRYRAARGRAPETVEELVRGGYLASRPEEPFGGRYRLDPQTGLAGSTTGHGRLKIYTPPGMGAKS
jgi:hypothetical protein